MGPGIICAHFTLKPRPLLPSMPRRSESSNISPQSHIPKNAFSSFDILNNHQCAVIQAHLTEEEANLQDLRRAVEDAEEHLRYLKDLVINSTFRIFELRSPSAPWRKLPNELLAHIFLLTKNAGGKNLLTGRNSIPWKLAQVCSRWRFVARGTPSLWIDIPFFRKTTHDLCSNITSLMRLNAPLPVRIFLTVSNPEMEPYLHPVYAFVNTIAPRIGALKLSLDRLSNFTSLSALTGDFTALESLSIHFNLHRVRPTASTTPTAIPAFEKATALRKLRIFNGRMTHSMAVNDWVLAAIPPVVASRIDTLVVGHITVSNLATLFNHFSALSQCAFLLCPSGDIPAIPTKSLQRLNRVKLCTGSYESVVFQLHHFLELLAPRLTHLTLWWFRVAFLPSYWSMGDQDVGLQHLDLRGSEVCSDLLVQTLASLPNLTHFYCTPPINFFDILSRQISSGKARISPHLSLFYIESRATVRHDILYISNMANWLSNAPAFSEIHIRYHDQEDLLHLLDGPYVNVNDMIKYQSMDKILKACQPLPQSPDSALESVRFLISFPKPWLTAFAGFGKYPLCLQHNPRPFS